MKGENIMSNPFSDELMQNIYKEFKELHKGYYLTMMYTHGGCVCEMRNVQMMETMSLVVSM